MRLDAKASAHQLEMGYALTNLAALYEAQERYDRAIKLLKRAAGIKQALSDSDPENTKYLTSLANTIDWLGRTADEMGDKAGQIQYLHQGVELRRQLAESSHDADARHQLSVALHDLASEQQVRGQLEESNQNSTESLSISQSLVMLDSTNAEWRGKPQPDADPSWRHANGARSPHRGAHLLHDELSGFIQARLN